MSIVQATNQVNIIDNIGLSIKTRYLDFWMWVNREPISAIKKLSDWVWTKLSGLEWVSQFIYKKQLHQVLSKLDGLEVTGDKLLTRKESISTFKIVLKKLQGQTLTKLEESVFQHLINIKYMKEIFSPDKEKLISGIEEILKRGSYFRPSEDPIFYKYFHPAVFLFNDASTLLAIDKTDFINLVHFDNKNITQDQSTQSFKTLIKILRNPDLSSSLTKIGSCPFQIEGSLLHKDSPELRKVLNFDFSINSEFFGRLNEMSDHLRQLGDFDDLAKQLEAGSLDIQTATKIGVISLYVTKIASKVREDQLTPEEKTLFRIVRKFAYKPGYNPIYNLDKWMFLEKQIKETIVLREQLEKGSKIPISQVVLYSKISILLCEYSGFLKDNSHWPCEILKEVSKFIPFKIDFFYLDANFIEILNDDKKRDILLDKVRRSIQLRAIAEEDRITEREYNLICKLSLVNIEIGINKEDLEIYENLLKQIPQLPVVRLCFHKIESPKETDKVIARIFYAIISLFVPYHHASILEVENKKFYLSEMVFGRVVKRKEISGKTNKLIETLEVDVRGTLPYNFSEDKKELFQREFVRNVHYVITHASEKLYVPETADTVFSKFFSGFKPQILSDLIKPFLTDNEPKAIFCSEFAMQTIVEAYSKTCETFCIPSPTHLSFFGVKKLEGVTPKDLKTALQSKKMLRPLKEMFKAA